MADLMEVLYVNFQNTFSNGDLNLNTLSRLHSHIFPREHLDSIQKSVLPGVVDPNQNPQLKPLSPNSTN